MDPALINKPVQCEICTKTHKYGDADWRTCQEVLFDRLVENPDSWEFKPTEDQLKRVKEAHSAYLTEFVGQGVTTRNPDLHAIRLLVTREFMQNPDERQRMKQLNKFWDDFQNDMPEPFKDKGFRHSLSIAWSDRKIGFILKQNNLKFVEWDQKELTCNLKIPDSLIAVASGLTALFSEGWELYHFDTESLEGTTLAKYSLRREKT